jgi:hypothetical protein
MATAPEPLRLFEAAPEGREEHSHVEAGRPALFEGPLQGVAEAGRLVARAQARFVAAVVAARRAGCSWRLIGTAAGVPYQSLHRRFAGQRLPDVPARDARHA